MNLTIYMYILLLLDSYIYFLHNFLFLIIVIILFVHYIPQFTIHFISNVNGKTDDMLYVDEIQ